MAPDRRQPGGLDPRRRTDRPRHSQNAPMTAASAWPPARTTFDAVDVLDSQMAYVVGGPATAPATLLFTHGNPTSSFLWRHVIADLVSTYRCIAVDLIGMGRSGKPDIAYVYADHARYLEAFAHRIGLRDAVLIGHDWGAVLGLDLMCRRPDVIAAAAVCEGHLHPFTSWEQMDHGSRDLFQPLRTPGIRERMVLEENFFIETVLPGGIEHSLSPDEWQAYRAPYPTPADRVPILQWIQQIPIGQDPPDVTRIVLRNQQTLLHGPGRRLLLHGMPGAVVGAAEVAWCRQESTGLDITCIGAGTHFLPEDQPEAIAREIRSWLAAPS
jgi:haloalkane dehalogenase